MIDSVPEFELTEEQREFRREIKRFVDNEIRPLDFNEYEWRDDPRDRIPWDVVDKGAEQLDLMYVTVPEEYGGLDIDPLSFVVAVEELTAGDMGIGHIFTYEWKHTKTIDLHATQEVKDEFYGKFMDDHRYLVASCGTEPGHGSDNVLHFNDYQLDTTAEKDGDAWVLNGEKRFITNAADAQAYLVRAQTDPNAPANDGATLFLVDREWDGVEVTHVHEKISQRLINNATIEFDEVRVPEERVLGEVGGGMRLGVTDYDPVEAAATTLGTARRAFEDALEYAHDRVQGGTEIINHQAVANDFAGMYADLQAARQLIWMTARALEKDAYSTEMGAMSNMYASKVGFDVATRALEKWGGAGIMLDSPAQKYVRDTLSYLHSSGTEDVLKEKMINALLDHPVGSQHR